MKKVKFNFCIFKKKKIKKTKKVLVVKPMNEAAKLFNSYIIGE